MAYKNSKGYGQFGLNRKVEPAHRVAFWLTHGRWPEPCCLHSCDTPSCVNVAHLFEGTNADNNADRDAKGRHVALKGVYNGQAKLTDQQVMDIRANWLLCRVTKRELGRRFGISETQIGRIIRGDNRTKEAAHGTP